MVQSGLAFCNRNIISSKVGTVIIGEELIEQDAWKYSRINKFLSAEFFAMLDHVYEIIVQKNY